MYKRVPNHSKVDIVTVVHRPAAPRGERGAGGGRGGAGDIAIIIIWLDYSTTRYC